MAKIVIHHDVDPGIAIVLEEVFGGISGRARGVHGVCTACGWLMHRWARDNAIRSAKEHVDGHLVELPGGDTDALIR